MLIPLTPLFLSLLAVCINARSDAQKPLQVDAWQGSNATLLRTHALDLMEKYPLLDTHVDMPQILRTLRKSFDPLNPSWHDSLTVRPSAFRRYC